MISARKAAKSLPSVTLKKIGMYLVEGIILFLSEKGIRE